ncbi:unnamed protein product [Urochloa decumbens]|uniref:Late embryogenesis abundant protein LEA-2 subgroup domain-containing protein n=1 Tax=Urochloa decumbens TaxID=240449 RepID=A0ABC9E2A8_9POAL
MTRARAEPPASAMATTLQRAPWSRRWSTKKFILAAMLGALVAVVVVASISISLAPARLAFSVVYANISMFPSTERSLTTIWFYNLTLEANNTSWRTEVSFVSLSAVIWQSETAWIPADEESWSMPPLLPQGSTRVNFSVQGGQYNEEQAKGPPLPPGALPPPPPPTASSTDADEAAGNSVPANCTVVVEAKVKFRAGGVSTLPYTVTASCKQVDFESGLNETQRIDCNS